MTMSRVGGMAPTQPDIPHNATYRALFRLRMGEPADDGDDNVLPDQPIAHLDVTDKGGNFAFGHARHLAE